jgi:hypothetical protein
MYLLLSVKQMKWVLLEKIKPNLFKNIQSTCLILAMEVMDHLLEDLAKFGYKLRYGSQQF